MGVKHSTRRELLVDGSAGAGDSAAIDCSSTRRSSSCKGRSRRSKIARSHSDRTPTSLSVNVLQYGDAATTNGTQDSSIAVVCSAVSTSSQTCVQSISVMTQTEPDELLEWRMIDDDCCDLMPDSPSKQVNVGNISNFDCSRTPDYRMSVDRELHCFRQECARCVRLMKAKSSSCDKDNCQPAVCCDDKIKDSSCSSYSKINPVCGTAGCSPTETDRIYSAVDISKPESNTISESGGITDVQKQITETNVDADVLKQLDKRKLSYSYECNSGGKRLSECMRVSQMECTNYRKNTVDLGSSFASLNSEDMMLDSERDDMMSPSNISSRQSSVEAGSLAYSHRSSNLTSSKFTAVPESCDYAGYQVNDNNNKAALRDGDSGVRKNFERVHNDAVADDFKRAVNGWIGLDPVSEVSPDDVFCSVNEVAADKPTIGMAHRRPLSLASESVLYALDATTYSHALHDVSACKTALHQMKQLLQQVESAPVMPVADCVVAPVFSDELEELRLENFTLKLEVERLQMLSEQQRITVELLQKAMKCESRTSVN